MTSCCSVVVSSLTTSLWPQLSSYECWESPHHKQFNFVSDPRKLFILNEPHHFFHFNPNSNLSLQRLISSQCFWLDRIIRQREMTHFAPTSVSQERARYVSRKMLWTSSKSTASDVCSVKWETTWFGRPSIAHTSYTFDCDIEEISGDNHGN